MFLRVCFGCHVLEGYGMTGGWSGASSGHSMTCNSNTMQATDVDKGSCQRHSAADRDIDDS